MPVSNEKRTNGGFTLAEALITLVVLGIIAALTVPALKRFSQKETTVMQLKKAYSTMNGALDYAIADDITMDIAKIGGDEFFLNHMLPHMNVLKQCSSANMGDCVSTEAENLPFQPANAAILGDGSTIANNGMDFFVDINGANEPNIAGVDIYQYKLQKVKGDNQAAMKYDFGILMADIMNVLTPKAYAFSFGGPSGGISTSSSRGGSSSSSFGGSSSSSSRITSTSSSRGSSTSSSSFGGSSTSSSSLFGSSSSSSRGTSSSSSSFGSTSSSSSRGINDINKPIETQTPADLGGFQNCPAKCGYCGNGIMTPCDQIKGDNTSSSGSTTPNLDPCVVLGTCGGDKPPVNHGPFVPSSGSSVITSSGSNCGSSFTGPNCSSSSGSSSSSKGSTSSGGITTSTSSGSGNSSSGNTSSSSTSGSSSSSGTTSSGTTSSGGGEVFPSSSSSSSSSSKINSTSSSSGSSNVPNDEVTEATNTAGWRFVPIGKSAEIMNNNWKIKNW